MSITEPQSNSKLTECKITFHYMEGIVLQLLVMFLKKGQSVSSVAQSCPTLCDPMNCGTPGFPVHHQPQSSLRLASIESVMPSSHLIICRPLLLLPPIPPSIRVFSNESTLRRRWPKYFSVVKIPR